MKFIPLSRHPQRFALVDDEDYESLSKYKWHFGGKRYATRIGKWPDGRQRTLLMHREILGVPDGVHVDHISGNGLVNIRANLRKCTRSENLRNQKKHTNNTSGFRGVDFNKVQGKWRARIQLDGKSIALGSYNTPELAAAAYIKAARVYHGEFARPCG